MALSPLSALSTPLYRFFDVRPGEARSSLPGLAGMLLFLIAGHTTLEAARDALLLVGPGPGALGAVYIAIAAGTVPASWAVGRASARFGQERALAGSIAVAVVSSILLFVVPMSHAAAMATYVTSGILGSIVVPQFWTLAGTVLTVSQARRLFGLISAAGVLGGVIGPAVATAALVFVPVKALLLVAACFFLIGGVLLRSVRAAARPPHVRPRPTRGASFRALREQAFLLRIAGVVVLSTATFLTLDYLFKASVARALAPAEIGPFVARFSLLLNGLSLVVQVFLSGPILRRLGVVAAFAVTPMLLFAGASLTVLSRGAFLAVLVVKGVDGSLRYSLHRITEELSYLPVPVLARQRAKPLIDGTFVRTAQMATGAALLGASGTWLLAAWPLGAVVALLALLWLAMAITVRTPYLALLRRAISSGSLAGQESPGPVDLPTAELLVQGMGSEDALGAMGAMWALSRRNRGGLIPSLVLLRPEEAVLLQALEIFGASERRDWFALARRLLQDERETVRIAAARALARHEALDADSLSNDVGWQARGYAAVRTALREGTEDALLHPKVAALLGQAGEAAAVAGLGMLAALADAPPSRRLGPLLVALCRQADTSVQRTEHLARAAARQEDPQAIPFLVERLAMRDGREAVREALVSFGGKALDGVWATLRDPRRPRRLRLHMPMTLARFGTARAAHLLLESIETEPDLLVRHKSIRALGIQVAAQQVAVDRGRIERLCHAELVTHFRVLATLAALGRGRREGERPTIAERLLTGLLEDELRQSLDRAFRLLEIAYPGEDIHRAYLACGSADPYARANAREFLDTLLQHRAADQLRGLLRIAAEDLPPDERVRRSLDIPPETAEEALVRLLSDPDMTLASLAAVRAAEIGDDAVSRNVEDAKRERPEIDTATAGLLARLREAHHA